MTDALPAVDSWEFACSDPDCEAGQKGTTTVMPPASIARVFPGVSHIPGYPPARGDVTHVCVNCGRWYSGLTDELVRRLEEEQRQVDAGAAAARETKHETYGWVEPHRAAADEIYAAADETPTPYDIYCALLTHLVAAHGPITDAEHADIVHLWVPHMPRERAESMCEMATDRGDIPPDAIIRDVADYM